MKKALLLLSGLMTLMLANASLAAPAPNESQNYTLNTDRSTWLIRSGSGVAKVMEYRPESEFGPGFVIGIKYEVNVLMRGKQTGELDIFVPERVFDRQQFLQDLVANHPMSLGSFMVDYEGTGNARDASGNTYEECAKTRIYDIDQDYKPNMNEAKIVRFDHKGSIKAITDLEIRMKVADGVPVLGAVEIDLSGVSDQGLPFEIGMDMVPGQ